MTIIVQPLKEDIFSGHNRYVFRHLGKDDFITKFGSGTLKKSHKLGFNIDDTYIQERTRFEFGLGFECVPSSRVTYSDIKLVSCQAFTELGWHAERMIEMNPFQSDIFVCKQFDVEYSSNKMKSGAGILVKQTSAPWIPKGYIVFSIVAEKKGKKYKNAINPF